MQDGIDAIIASTSDHPAHSGLVVGVLKGGQGSVHGYGTAGEATPAGDTIFEIGSVTKVFTTTLLSILAAEDSVALDDPVASLAAELARFPAQITLQHLATHTAGLPKMPSNIIRSMLRDRGNPYAAYSTDDLLRYLSKHPPQLRRVEARRVSYSNLGMALLGTLLARKLDLSYEAAIVGRICEPLGMMDTGIQLTPDQERRLAAPHNPRGKRVRNWDLPAFAGAGALMSTAEDLLTFLAAHLGSGPSSLTAPLQECHAVRAKTFAPPGALERLVARVSGGLLSDDRTQEGMALGWTVGRLPSGEAQVHWHHGATGGYRAFVGFVQAKRIAVVVLANSGPRMREGVLGTTATDRVGFRVLEHLVEVS
ncbi:MAG: serine hydrolase domain-containing protein [Thermoanaerobaculales bacterium]